VSNACANPLLQLWPKYMSPHRGGGASPREWSPSATSSSVDGYGEAVEAAEAVEATKI
jgi:hypothetical protein